MTHDWCAFALDGCKKKGQTDKAFVGVGYDINRSKDDGTSVAEGKSCCQSVHSVLHSHHCHCDDDGDNDLDHGDDEDDLVHAVGHGEEDDGTEGEVEEKCRPAGCLHLDYPS